MSAAPSIDEVLALRRITRSELAAQGDVTIDADVGYGSLRGVERLHSVCLSPAHFFFAGDELKLVYVPRAALAGARVTQWLSRAGDGARLPSRIGGRTVLEVRPRLGLAFAHAEGELQLAEVFAPTTLECYERAIYEHLGSFVR